MNTIKASEEFPDAMPLGPNGDDGQASPASAAVEKALRGCLELAGDACKPSETALWLAFAYVEGHIDAYAFVNNLPGEFRIMAWAAHDAYVRTDAFRSLCEESKAAKVAEKEPPAP